MPAGRKIGFITMGAVGALIVAACSSGGDSGAAPADSASASSDIPTATSTPTPMPTPTPASTAVGTATATPPPTVTLDPSRRPTQSELGISTFAIFEWPRTDFTKRSVEFDEIVQAQSRDGIPAINTPRFDSLEFARTWLSDRDPVLAIEVNGEAKAYPLGILLWHEIVNDTIGGLPVAVTYCPLCNSALAFERTLNGVTVEFGVSGMLRNSDLIMFDRLTDTWWQQLTGEAIVGELTGTRLTTVPVNMVGLADFEAEFPDGLVMTQQTGFEGLYGQSYGINPYGGYDSEDNNPFLFFGKRDDRLPLMERLVALEINGQSKAYPFSDVSRKRVMNDEVGGLPLVVFWKSGSASALNKQVISTSKDVGSTAVFDRTVEGRTLTFEATDDGFIDVETGSTWNLFGTATAGPMKGVRLQPIIHANHFWFAWAVFHPDTLIYGKDMS